MKKWSAGFARWWSVQDVMVHFSLIVFFVVLVFFATMATGFVLSTHVFDWIPDMGVHGMANLLRVLV